MKPSDTAVLASLRRLAGDLTRDAGVRSVSTAAFVLVGAFVESIGLLLLIPFLSLVIDARTTPTFLQQAMDSLFRALSANTRAEKLAYLIAIFAALLLFRAFVIVRRDTLLARLQLGFMERVRSRLTHKLAAADWAVTSKLRHSTIVHVIGSDIQQLGVTTYILCHDSVTVVVLLSQIAVAVYLSPAMAAVAAVAVGVGAITLLPMLERARKFGAFVTSANQSLAEDTSQFMGALKLAVSQNLQDGFTKEFDASLANLTAEQVRYTRRQTLTQQAMTTTSSLVAAGVVILGVAVFNVPASVLIALLLIFTRINSPATQLYFDLQHLAQTLPAYEKITRLEDDLTADKPASSVRAVGEAIPARGAIQFRSVTFLHGHREGMRDDRGGVRAITLDLEPGSIVGISGASGAGKTTFADLLVGLYPQQAGTIFIGGTELRASTVGSWRDRVSYVAQDPFLFHDSIRRNLLWARPDADEPAIWDALAVAGIADFVRKMPRGLESIVGERGTLISGGERQRIALARAILRKPSLLVLDEATNAIDIDGEEALLGRLTDIAPRPTIVIVSHRTESLRSCERVFRFEDGRVVADESGPAVPTITAHAAKT